MKMLLTLAAAIVSAAILTSMVVTAQDTPAATKVLTPSEAKVVAQRDSSKVVSIKGQLQNAGTNYFTDSRLVLKNGSGEIDVEAWLPMTVEDPMDSAGVDKPKVISDYLGKNVVLTGMVTKQSVKGVAGLRDVPVVTDADVARK